MSPFVLFAKLFDVSYEFRVTSYVTSFFASYFLISHVIH